jgi:hypothetical protein
MTDSVLQRLAKEFQIEEDPEDFVSEVANAPSNLENPPNNDSTGPSIGTAICSGVKRLH